MKKAIIYDADGVIIRREKYFSQRFSDDFGVSMDKILPFYKNEFQLCLVGKVDLKEELKEYLAVWGWNKPTDELLDYWFRNESTISQELIDNIASLREEGTKCYLATNNEKYRVKYLLENLRMAQLFDGVFASCEVGFLKSDQEFWEYVGNQIDCNFSEALVIDDEEKNLVSSQSLVFQTLLYKDFN